MVFRQRFRRHVTRSDSRRVSRGQALVELAMIAPVLSLLMLGAIDLGRVWQSQITIENAAREGAMEGIFKPTSYSAGDPCDATSNRIMCRILNEVDGSDVDVTPADVTVICTPACTPGTTGTPHRVVVEVQGHFSLLTPLMAIFTGGQDLTLTAEAEATIAMTPTGGTFFTPTPSPSPTPTPFATPTPTPSGSVSPTPTPTPTPAPQPCVAPVANFTVVPASLTGKKNVTLFSFTDTSTNMNNPICNRIWSWSFGDGSGASSAQNPSYTYSKKCDPCTVTLSVSNTAGTTTKQVVVHVTN